MEERTEEATEGRAEPIRLLRKDLRAAAKLMSAAEARYQVDLYYQIQDFRKATANQIRSVEKTGEPILTIDWTFATMELMESTIKRALEEYTDAEPSGMGVYMKGVVGIGPVIAAGLLARIDIKKTRTVGGVWRFCGQDPTSVWLGKKGAQDAVEKHWNGKATPEENVARLATEYHRSIESLLKLARDEKGRITKASTIAALAKRPWDAAAKVLCWKAGESFTKLSGRDDCFYGQKYLERKAMEWEKNLTGAYSNQARDILAAKQFGKDTTAYAWYSSKMSPSLARRSLDGQGDEISLLKPQKVGDEIPMLPPGHIHARAKRWAVKLFLSHVYEEWYRRVYKKEPPVIYSIAMMGHLHKIDPPK